MFDASPSRLVNVVFALRRGVRKDNFTRPTAARSAFKARCLFVRERVNSGGGSLPNCLKWAELKGEIRSLSEDERWEEKGRLH